jgi:hypothetical protein
MTALSSTGLTPSLSASWRTSDSTLASGTSQGGQAAPRLPEAAAEAEVTDDCGVSVRSTCTHDKLVLARRGLGSLLLDDVGEGVAPPGHEVPVPANVGGPDGDAPHVEAAEGEQPEREVREAGVSRSWPRRRSPTQRRPTHNRPMGTSMNGGLT